MKSTGTVTYACGVVLIWLQQRYSSEEMAFRFGRNTVAVLLTVQDTKSEVCPAEQCRSCVCSN